jgi:hypothetical protein
MAQPATMRLTPRAAVTVAVGYATDASQEFWQRLPGGLHTVFSNVPRALALNLLETRDVEIDSAIQLMLGRGYPVRVSS